MHINVSKHGLITTRGLASFLEDEINDVPGYVNEILIENVDARLDKAIKLNTWLVDKLADKGILSLNEIQELKYDLFPCADIYPCKYSL